ncbi:DUF2793 domain-containing protein [Falsiroseomonas sp.]|uniref:DUF2793 domain-containing protein n=1 Tax=Falsiroseomonas sp. TaxID=2870721 RepID=UPI00356B3743
MQAARFSQPLSNRRDPQVTQLAVQQILLNVPPGSPTEKECRIVDASPTGAWAGQASRVAQRIGGAWVFYAPFVGLTVFDAATLAQWGWNGSTWALVAPRRCRQASPTLRRASLQASARPRP